MVAELFTIGAQRGFQLLTQYVRLTGEPYLLGSLLTLGRFLSGWIRIVWSRIVNRAGLRFRSRGREFLECSSTQLIDRLLVPLIETGESSTILADGWR